MSDIPAGAPSPPPVPQGGLSRPTDPPPATAIRPGPNGYGVAADPPPSTGPAVAGTPPASPPQASFAPGNGIFKPTAPPTVDDMVSQYRRQIQTDIITRNPIAISAGPSDQPTPTEMPGPGLEPPEGTRAREIYDWVCKTPAAAWAFINMTAAQQEQVCELADKLRGGSALRTAQGGQEHNTPSEVLGALLASGKATTTGADGHTLLDNLVAFAHADLPLPAGVTNAAEYQRTELNTLLQHVTNPNTIFQGTYRSCGTTTAQIAFASQRPADYVHFATGLMSREGVGVLPSGERVPREPHCFDPAAKDIRPASSRMMQSSLLHWAMPTYDYRDDHHGIDLPIAGRFAPVPGGTMAIAEARIMTAMGNLGQPLLSDRVSTVLEGGVGSGVPNDAVLDGASRELATQQEQGVARPMVPMALAWGTVSVVGVKTSDYHWVGVTAISNDRVYFQNPQGNSFQAVRDRDPQHPLPTQVDPFNHKTYVEYTNPQNHYTTRIYEDGTQSLPRDVVRDNMFAAVVRPVIANEINDRHAPNIPPAGGNPYARP